MIPVSIPKPALTGSVLIPSFVKPKPTVLKPWLGLILANRTKHFTHGVFQLQPISDQGQANTTEYICYSSLQILKKNPLNNQHKKEKNMIPIYVSHH